jgi:acetyltransferase-like isoleucine patch superfamily enzyme
MAALDRPLRRGAYRLVMATRGAAPAAERTSRRVRAATFAARAAAIGRWRDGRVVVEAAPDADIGRVLLDVWPGTTTHVVIGSRARLRDGVLLSLRGGVLDIGEETDVRRGVTMHVGGRLVIGRGCLVSTGVCLHCAESVEVGDLTIVGEYSTLADSWHRRTPPGVPIHHSVATAPLRVGTNVWVGARVTVAAGVTVGDQCIVGSGAVVTRDVEPGWLVAGVPARPVRLLDEV